MKTASLILLALSVFSARAFELTIHNYQEATKERALVAKITISATPATSPVQTASSGRLVRVVVLGAISLEKAWEPLFWYVAPLGETRTISVAPLASPDGIGFYGALVEEWIGQ